MTPDREFQVQNVLLPDVELFYNFYFSAGSGYKTMSFFSLAMCLEPHMYTIPFPTGCLLTTCRVESLNHFKSDRSRQRILDEEEETEIHHNLITLGMFFLQNLT